MLIDAERSWLLAIDLQAKLVPALAGHEAVVANAAWLIRLARKVGVPAGATMHYPKGLGALVPAIATLLPKECVATKTHFSCVASGCLAELPGNDRAQVVILGAEAHVCVLQSALELMEEGKEVYVVADCIGSQRPADRDVAITRMRDEGVRVVTREMVAFEWLGEAGTPLFREVIAEFFK